MDKNPFKLFSINDRNTKYTIDELRWGDFGFIFLRSIGSIIITSFKNIWDSFQPSQQIIIPPDEGKIEDLDMVLRNTLPLDYFYNYLEQLGNNDVVGDTLDDKFRNINNYRLLALYMDIRCYDN